MHAPWGGEKVCPTPPHPAKRRLCPAPPCENYQNLWGAEGQSWFQSIEIWKAITRKDSILSDKYSPHSQISWFTHFFCPASPRPVHPWYEWLDDPIWAAIIAMETSDWPIEAFLGSLHSSPECFVRPANSSRLEIQTLKLWLNRCFHFVDNAKEIFQPSYSILIRNGLIITYILIRSILEFIGTIIWC